MQINKLNDTTKKLLNSECSILGAKELMCSKVYALGRGGGYFLIKKPKKHNTCSECDALLDLDFMGLGGGRREQEEKLQKTFAAT